MLMSKATNSEEFIHSSKMSGNTVSQAKEFIHKDSNKNALWAHKAPEILYPN